MRKKNKDPLLRAACRIHRQLEQLASAGPESESTRFGYLSEECSALCRGRQRVALARSRGWTLAARGESRFCPLAAASRSR